MSKVLPGIVFLALGGGAFWLYTQQSPATPPVAPPEQPEQKVVPEVKKVEKADLPANPKPDQPTATKKLRFPNGTLVEPLNGVTDPALCVWGDAPWSPIVRKEHNGNMDWYVHADGTYTTTMMQWRSDLKREDAVTLCLHPTKPIAVESSGDPSKDK